MLTSSSFLLVGNDIPTREYVANTLRKMGHSVLSAHHPKAVRSYLKKQSCAGIIFAPATIHEIDEGYFSSWHEEAPSLRIFLFTHSFDDPLPSYVTFVPPPYTTMTLERLFPAQGREKNRSGAYPRERIVAESPALQQILSLVEKIGPTRASVFLCGESGVGKEVIAQALHQSGPLSNTPFVKINCASIPETLAETAFFGHEKGSFTGAYETRKGHFERAHGGTLLLDEISEIPHTIQAKLLRVTQDFSFERVGGSHPIEVDVRMISTSNREMSELVHSRILRQDLYYRLNTIPIHIPPLRNRTEDILPLAEYFMEKVAWQNRIAMREIAPSAAERLQQYDWPGNVRELGHVIERAMIIHEGSQLEASHLQFHPFAVYNE